MLDLQTKVDHLEIRVSALERSTVSGVPNLSIEQRFSALHDRVDDVGRNVLDKIDKLDKRMDKFDQRMDKFDQRMDGFERRMDGFERRLDDLQQDVNLLKQDVSQLKQDVGELKLGMVDIMSMLASLGATAPERRVN
ncbi:hypothetical protein [Nonomuraea harbinensis]|uniref:t-SNARE coiled-coil homology domain-containing protein n=1 Tax=Nonomuraea harbinensis TaxID=1286938 RepID=A0ABW1C2H8_9ACTN|nr:hypothetical protein [Nonomuraea harbinensis]